MLSIPLDQEVEDRLQRLAAAVGKSPADVGREAILEMIEDWEDAELAAKRLVHPTRIYSADEAKRELGL